MLYHDTEAGEGTVFARGTHYCVVKDQDEMEEKMESGWRETLDAEEKDELSELKAQAKALGIKLTGKSADTLRKEIAEHDSGG